MATYIDKSELTERLIINLYEDSETDFTTFITPYLNRADSFFIQVIKDFGLQDSTDIPTYTEGMNFDVIDMLRKYIYKEVLFDEFSNTRAEDDFYYRKYLVANEEFDKAYNKITKEKIENDDQPENDNPLTIPRVF